MHVQNLMNSLWDIRTFLGLVPKESHCINLRATYWAKILTVYVRLPTAIENVAPRIADNKRLVDNTRPCLDSTCNNTIMFRTGKVAGLSLGQKNRYHGWSNLQFSPLSSAESLDYTNRYDKFHQTLLKSF